MQQDEFRETILGRVALFAPGGGKIRLPTSASTVGIMLFIGSLLVRKGKKPQGNCVLMLP